MCLRGIGDLERLEILIIACGERQLNSEGWAREARRECLVRGSGLSERLTSNLFEALTSVFVFGHCLVCLYCGACIADA